MAYDNDGYTRSTTTITVSVLPLLLDLGKPVVEGSNTRVVLGTTLPNGRAYAIEWSTDLTGPVNWTARPMDCLSSSSIPFPRRCTAITGCAWHHNEFTIGSPSLAATPA